MLRELDRDVGPRFRGLEDGPGLADLIAAELRARSLGDVKAEDVLAYDLMLYDTQPSSVAGARG